MLLLLLLLSFIKLNIFLYYKPYCFIVILIITIIITITESYIYRIVYSLNKSTWKNRENHAHTSINI